MLSISAPVHLEIIGLVPGYLAILIKAFLAIFLGGIIGLDREKKLKPAGVKTQILICVGATLYTMVGMSNVPEDISTYDPNRIAAQIVSGIGFLGAGAIIQGHGKITGLTTAASIWIVAAIGITVGSGQIITATFFTLIIWITLNVIKPVLDFVRPQKKIHIQIVGGKKIEKEILHYLEKIEDDDFDLNVFIHEDGIQEQIDLKVELSPSELKRFIRYFNDMAGVKSIDFKTVS